MLLSRQLGTFARKLASLKQYGLVRLAAQAVQPSQNIVAYRPWSGRYAPCFSPTSPRFIRHRRRFGDVARTRSSSGAFAGECAELPTEICKLSTAARRCGCRAGTARLLFFCRRFLFQIKRKCRNAGSIYHLIIVHSEGKKRFLRGFRAAVAAAVRRGRRTLQVAPNRLQISIHQPVLPYYAALYMQKSRQTLLPGLMLFYKVY